MAQASLAGNDLCALQLIRLLLNGRGTSSSGNKLKLINGMTGQT